MHEGLDVAWNRVKLQQVEVEERVKLLQEVNLLKRLEHPNILRFLKGWLSEGTDENRGEVTINFITEQCSDNLRKYVP